MTQKFLFGGACFMFVFRVKTCPILYARPCTITCLYRRITWFHSSVQSINIKYSKLWAAHTTTTATIPCTTLILVLYMTTISSIYYTNYYYTNYAKAFHFIEGPTISFAYFFSFYVLFVCCLLCLISRPTDIAKLIIYY